MKQSESLAHFPESNDYQQNQTKRPESEGNFGEICSHIERHYEDIIGKVSSVLYFRVGVPLQKLEDFCSVGILRTIQRSETAYVDPSGLSSYIIRASRNAWLDSIKKQDARRRASESSLTVEEISQKIISDTSSDLVLEDGVDTLIRSDLSETGRMHQGASLEDIVILNESVELCMKQLSLLSEREASALLLIAQEYSSREISKRLGMSVPAVKSMIHRARRKMKQEESLNPSE